MDNEYIKELDKKYNIKLNEQQKKCVCHTVGPALVFSVAGSGKTTALICHLRYLITRCNVPVDKLLSITFSRASANDMKARYLKTFGNEEGICPKFSTIHSLSYRIVLSYFKKRNKTINLIEEGTTALNTSSGTIRATKRVVISKLYTKYNKTYVTDDVLDELLGYISFYKNKMISWDKVDYKEISIDNFKNIVLEYEQLKKDNNLIDFDDMLVYAYKILSQDKSELAFYQQQWDYISVDEGQDTSTLQFSIINLLVERTHNLYVLGDDDQTIYEWRSAEPGTLLNFDKIYKGAKIYKMEQNYRSIKTIVEVSSKFIQKNKKRYKKNMFTDNTTENDIIFRNYDSLEEQANSIIEEIESRGNTKTGTAAILYRNNISSIPFVNILVQKGIPFSISDDKANFFRNWVVDDIKSFLKVALHPYDIDIFRRIYYKMNAYISKNEIYRVEKFVHSGLDIFEALKKTVQLSTNYKISRVADICFYFMRIKKMEPIDAINSIVNVMGYSEYLSKQNTDKDISVQASMQKIYNLKIIAKNCKTIPEFFEYLENLENIIKNSKSSKEKQNIILTTSHSSKGLEFDEVYIVDLLEGIFPAGVNGEKTEEEKQSLLEAENRLFYVSLTRSRRRLVLSYPSKVGPDKVWPSKYINDIKKIVKSRSSKDTDTEVEEEKEVCNNSTRFPIGAEVIHNKFGRGIVSDKTQGKIIVHFMNYGEKSLLESMCISGNFLRIID